MPRQVLPRLASNDLVYIPEPPVFVNLTAGILGQADGDLAGTDSNLLDLANTVLSEVDQGSGMDQDLGDAGFVPGQLAASTYAPVAMDYAAFIPGGDGAVTDFATGVGAGSPAQGPGPQPQPPAPPGSTGSPPASNVCSPIIGAQPPCTFTAAQQAGFLNMFKFNAVHQGCGGGKYVLTYNSEQFWARGYVPTSVALVSGDGSVLQLSFTNDLRITPQGTVTLTFSTQNVGAWQFVVSGTFAYTSARPQVGVCFQVVP